MGLRYEAWTVPWDSAGFKRKVAMVPDVEGTGSGSVQFLSMPGNPSVDISLAKFGRLGEIISESTTSLMRVIDCLPDGTNKIIDEWVVERDPKHHQESKTASLTGWGLLSALDRALVYAFDYPANPTSQADHIWGGEQELGNPGFEDGQRRPQEWELEIDATAGTYTLSDGVDTTAPIPFNAQAGDISTAIQNDLGLIDDVTTTGTSVSPYLRTIYAVSPPIGINLTLDDSGLTGEGTLTESVEGEIMFSPWTANKYSPVPDPSGNYRRFEVTDEQAHSGTLSLAVRPNLIHPLSGRRPGIEQVLRVTPNQIYTWSIWIRPTNANDNFRIGVFSYGGDEQIVLSGVQNPPINTWTQLSIGPFVMPPGIGQARFIVFWANSTNSEYNPSVAYFDDGGVFEGLAPTSIGDIWTVLLDDATVDHAADPRGTVLDWLDYSSFTDAVDSGGNAWNEMALPFSARWGSTYGHVLDDTLNLGYEVELVPKDTPVGGKTHDLRIYNPMGRDDNPSVGLNTNKPVFGGDVISRAPKYSASLIASPDGSWTEAKDATSVANFGRLEMHHSAPEAADEISRDLIASNLFAFEAANRQAVEFKMVETLSGHRPFVHFRGGDTVAMSQPPGLLKQNRRVQRIDYVNTHPTQYTIVGSRVLRGEAAAYDLIRRMWRRMNRPGKFTPKGADPIPSTGTPFIDVAAADAPQWEKDGARYQCDGVDDHLEIFAAMFEHTGKWREVTLSSGNFYVDPSGYVQVPETSHLRGQGPYATFIRNQDNVATPGDFQNPLILVSQDGVLSDLGFWTTSDFDGVCVTNEYGICHDLVHAVGHAANFVYFKGTIHTSHSLDSWGDFNYANPKFSSNRHAAAFYFDEGWYEVHGLNHSGGGVGVFLQAHGHATLTNVRIDNGFTNVQPLHPSPGIIVDDTGGLALSNVAIRAPWSSAIRFDAHPGDVVISNAALYGAYGISTLANAGVTSVLLDNVAIVATTTGIHIESIFELIIRGLRITKAPGSTAFGFPIVTGPAAYLQLMPVSVSTGLIPKCIVSDFHITGFPSGSAHSANIFDNGLVVEYRNSPSIAKILIHDGFIENVHHHGLIVEGVIPRIHDVTTENVGRAAANTYDAFRLIGPMDRPALRDNDIRTPSQLRYGINIVDSGVVGAIVTDNFLDDDSDYGTAAINNNGTGTILGNFGDGSGGGGGGTSSSKVVFSQAGTLSMGSGSFKLPFTLDAEIISVQLAVGTSPTGADLIVDVNKNGTTIFTTQANRPTVPDGDANGVGAEATPDVTAIAEGDYLTVDIDQVGSTVAGENLTVSIEWRPT